MREFGLLHAIDPSLPSPRLKANPYEDYESSLPLEFDFANDAPLTDLKKVFGPPLTSLPLVASSFSGTPVDTTIIIVLLLASPLLLDHARGLRWVRFLRMMLVL